MPPVLNIYNGDLTLNRTKHLNADIELIIRYAEARGWGYESTEQTGGCWGRIFRGNCLISIWLLPQNTDYYTRQIIRRLKRNRLSNKVNFRNSMNKKHRIMEFSIQLKNIREVTDDLENKLYQFGCDDALLCRVEDGVFLDFANTASDLEEAISLALNKIEAAGFKGEVVR